MRSTWIANGWPSKVPSIRMSPCRQTSGPRAFVSPICTSQPPTTGRTVTARSVASPITK